MAKFEFNARTTRYTLLNALQLARAAELTYKSDVEIKDVALNKWKFTDCEFYKRRNIEAFAAVNDEVIIIAFRGTESIEDWLTDLKTKFLPIKRGRVHQGFNEGLDYIWSDLIDLLNRYNDTRRTIWLTGHSLGGALATLAVDRLLDGWKINGLYTFGSPRVGDKKFRKQFDAQFRHRTFRFVNDEDIVPRVPPRNIGYYHIGRIRYFDAFGIIHHEVRWWKKLLSKSISSTARSRDRLGELKNEYPGGILDHGMAYYIKHIRKSYLAWKKKNQPKKFTFVDHINS